MILFTPNDFFKDDKGDYIRIVSVDGDLVTVEQRRTGEQRILALEEMNGKIAAGLLISEGRFGPDEANWPGAN